MVRRFLVALCLLCASFAASAFAPPARYTMSLGPYQTACGASTRFYADTKAGVPAATATGLVGCSGSPNAGWNGKYNAGASNDGEIYAGASFAFSAQISAATPVCPANSTGTSSCTCNAGYDEVGGNSCVAHVNQCTSKVGSVKLTNWTVAFFRTPDETDYGAVGPVNKLPVSGKFCAGGCEMTVPDAGAPGWAAWRSQTPNAQGLYRGSLDVPAGFTGAECAAGSADAPLNPAAVEPTCPGAVGEVNGKKGCYGTAQAPVTTTQTDRPPVPPVAGNPAAGPKPESGEGSGSGSTGRTPGTNNGNANAGGPAGAAVGGAGGSAGGTPAGSGTGTGTGANTGGRVGTQAGTEQAACGAPGQPKCDVKVDETGVPNGVGTNFDTANGQLDTHKDKYGEIRDKAAGSTDKGMFEQFRSIFLVPPIATCENVVLPEQASGKTIDVCAVVDGVRSVMAYIWALAALFLCLGMIKRSF